MALNYQESAKLVWFYKSARIIMSKKLLFQILTDLTYWLYKGKYINIEIKREKRLNMICTIITKWEAFSIEE